MDLRKEIITLRTLLDLTQSEIAKELNVTFETVNSWESSKHDVKEYNAEVVYSYAFKNKIYLNQIFEQLFKEEEKEQIKVLFQGCKRQLELPIDLLHCKVNNDFGIGFCLGENLLQVSTYFANSF